MHCKAWYWRVWHLIKTNNIAFMRKPSLYCIFGRDIHRYDYEILHIAKALQESSSGSCDPLLASHALVFYHFIQCRLEDWHDSAEFMRRVEDAIKAYIKEAAEIYRARNYDEDLELLQRYPKEFDFPKTTRELLDEQNEAYQLLEEKRQRENHKCDDAYKTELLGTFMDKPSW